MSTPKQILVIDVEATCWDNLPPNLIEASQRRNEIIEIGITPIDIKTNEIGLSRSIIVKPNKTTISTFCTKLTTLTPEFVEKTGITFPEAIEILNDDYRTDINIWASYGDYDRDSFVRNCGWWSIAYPFNNNHINVKALVGAFVGKHLGTGKACEKLGIPWEGTHHRGVDDSRMIAKILQRILAHKIV